MAWDEERLTDARSSFNDMRERARRRERRDMLAIYRRRVHFTYVLDCVLDCVMDCAPLFWTV